MFNTAMGCLTPRVHPLPRLEFRIMQRSAPDVNSVDDKTQAPDLDHILGFLDAIVRRKVGYVQTYVRSEQGFS
tara:strand:+ start:869 stop:1087 length:219 start_codon:yes stop_codon:yes gene_type:complete